MASGPKLNSDACKVITEFISGLVACAKAKGLVVGLSGGNGTSEIAVRDPVETAKSVVVQVKGQADVVILLSHAGASVDRQIADAVPGIALIVSGGPLVMPAPWRSEKTGTLVVHADEARGWEIRAVPSLHHAPGDRGGLHPRRPEELHDL